MWPQIADVRFTAAGSESSSRGLLGFVCFRYGNFRIDGATVRRTRGGELTVSYPSRTDFWGDRHPFVLPIGREAREGVQEQILAAVSTEVGL